MIPFRKSLAFRLLAISFILLSLPLLVDSFVIVQKGYEDAIKDAKRHLVEMAHLRERPIAKLQPAKRPLLVIIEHFLGLNKEFPAGPSKVMESKLEEIAKAGDFWGVFLLKRTPEGRIVVIDSNLPEFEGRDYTDLFQLYELYSQTVYERGFLSLISFDPQTLKPFYLVARVVFDESSHNPLGILMIGERLGDKLETLLAADKEEYTVNFALLLPDTIVFAASDKRLLYNYFAPLDVKQKSLFLAEEPSAEKVLAEKPLEISRTIGYPFFEFTWQGKTQIGYFLKMAYSNFQLLSYASKEEIFAHPLINFISVYGVYGLILIFGGSIAFMLTRRMARPMQSLSKVMASIQEGNLSMRYRSDTLGFEINGLGLIFNEMIDTLLQKKRIAEQERIERERYAKELMIGRQVQRSLLPEEMPYYPGIDLAERYLPAKEVGGDFYDVFMREAPEGNELVLAVADASGKGVRACFYSLGVRSMLRTYAQKFGDVKEILSKINQLFCEDTGDSGMFVTAVVGIYNYQNRTLRYFSAGHCPLMVLHANGEIILYDHMGASLGIEGGIRGKEQHVQLQRGDLALFYTDGITEAHNEKMQLFGDERLKQFLLKMGGKSASEVAEALLKEVNSFAGEAPQHDDITLLVMKII